MLRHITDGTWYTSSYTSNAGANCVECRHLGAATVAVRDSKNRSLGAFHCGADAWTAFISALKGAEAQPQAARTHV
ncbi:DUF397 domain-containing protein [Streptomyces sp. NBC_01775]|uniref:DUF397 domain-containing protein n=1 Tax=Streptomyces sp. NBC_01775 TaxID=2975939 RepID=UPI002DDB6462|nr:DUF397 domain-containing protein [Streptomyces sp. NBC_01775]WSB79687.1 DUF397 domain-containing protein [Streptomyces sp. NBC_01775]